MKTVKSLPRTPAEAGIIEVSLKRKLEYKTTHVMQLIDKRKIYIYLNFLKHDAKNMNYQFYDDLHVFMARCEEEDPEGFRMVQAPEEDEVFENLDSCQDKHNPEDEINEQNNSDEEAEREDFEYRKKDVIRKYQFDYDLSTCMVPKFPEAIPEIPDKGLSFAPGEGKIPTNILKEDDWDVKIFQIDTLLEEMVYIRREQSKASLTNNILSKD